MELVAGKSPQATELSENTHRKNQSRKMKARLILKSTLMIGPFSSLDTVIKSSLKLSGPNKPIVLRLGLSFYFSSGKNI